MSTGMELVKPADLNIGALAPKAESAELLEQALAGEKLTLGDFPRIKWPTGGATKFTRTILGNEEMVETITGVIVHQGMSRSYWKSPDPVEGQAPDCISPDAVYGYGDPGDKLRSKSPPQGCEVCPNSMFGSDPKEGSNAQACKLNRDLFMLVQGGGILPLAVSIPPGSLPKGKGYLVGLAEFGLPFWTVLTELSLVKATANNGTAYAQVRMRLAGKLDDATIEKVREYRDKMGPSFVRVMRDAENGDVIDADATDDDDGDK